jgi:hypothetical protein
MILKMDFCDPLILCSACSFTFNLLENEKVKVDKDYFFFVCEKMQNLQFLFPYLGDVKYDQLCNYLANKPGNNAVPLSS